MPDCSQLALSFLKMLLAGLHVLAAEAVSRLGVPGLCVLAAVALLALGISAKLFKLMTSARGMAVIAGVLLGVVAMTAKQPQQPGAGTVTYSPPPVASPPVPAYRAVEASMPLSGTKVYRFRCVPCGRMSAYLPPFMESSYSLVPCQFCNGYSGVSDTKIEPITHAAEAHAALKTLPPVNRPVILDVD